MNVAGAAQMRPAAPTGPELQGTALAHATDRVRRGPARRPRPLAPA